MGVYCDLMLLPQFLLRAEWRRKSPFHRILPAQLYLCIFLWEEDLLIWKRRIRVANWFYSTGISSAAAEWHRLSKLGNWNKDSQARSSLRWLTKRRRAERKKEKRKKEKDKNTKIQKYKNTKIQRYENTKKQQEKETKEKQKSV